MTNHTNYLRRIVSAMLLLAVTACLILPGAAGANPAGDSLGDVRQRVDDLLAGLKKQNSLTKSQLTSLRRDLASISFDLGTIQDDVNESYRQRGGGHGGGDQGDDNDHGNGQNNHDGHDWNDNNDHSGQNDHNNGQNDHGPVQGAGWDDFLNAHLSVNPSFAVFDGWKAGHKFDVRYVGSKPVLTVTNGNYEAEWTINDSALKGSEIAVKQQGDSDILLQFHDGAVSNELLIKNGGLGPIYIRKGGDKPKNPPPPKWVPNPMAWLQPYDDQVRTGQLEKSAGMEWFSQMVNQDKYDPAALAELGRYLRNNLPEQPRGEIAIMQYVSSKLPKQLSIPDPRSNVTGFVYAMDKALTLRSTNKSFTIVMK